MLQLSRLFPIFVTSFEKNRQKHREERISFDPSENLENSKYKGEKSESCFSCSCIYTAHPFMGLAHIYTCRCELIFHSYLYGYSRTFRLRMSKGLTLLCLSHKNEIK